MKILLIIVAASILILGCASKRPSEQEAQQSNISSIESRPGQTKINTYRQLTRKFQQEIKTGQVQIKQLEGGIKIIISNDILFVKDYWKIHKAGKEALDKIISVLKTYGSQTLEVYGFTDNQPVNPGLRKRFSSNWELSGARAIDVATYMEEKGINPDIISVTGYGDERPVASNDTPAGRQKNQRIEIIVMFSDL